MKKTLLSAVVAGAGFYASVAGQAFAAMPGPIMIGPAEGGIVMVECKYGGPHCVNPDPGPKPPKVNTNQFPDDGWTDPDCKYYGDLCDFPNEGWFGFPQLVVPPK
jgi:hypothetical protein